MSWRNRREWIFIIGNWYKFISFSSKKLQLFLSLFGLDTQKHPIVGLEISQGLLKFLKINSTTTPYQVEAFDVVPLPADAIVNNEIKDYNAVRAGLEELFKQAKVQTKYVAFAIPRSLAIIKSTSVDSRLNGDELESRAWIEANRHFPELVGEIHLDFTISQPAEDPSQVEMVLVACRKNHLNPYLEVLHHAGLYPKIADVNCYALERALLLMNQHLPTSDTIALLNLNLYLSSFVVLHKGALIYAQDQAFNGERLLSQVNSHVKDDQTKEGSNCDEILKENLLTFLRHTLHFFYASRPNIQVQRIILSGDCASIPELPSFVQKEINIETTVVDLFTSIQLAPDINQEAFTKHAPALMECLGLALSELKHA